MPKIFIKWQDIVGGMCDGIWDYNSEVVFNGEYDENHNHEYLRGQIELLRDTACRHADLSEDFDGSRIISMIYSAFESAKWSEADKKADGKVFDGRAMFRSLVLNLFRKDADEDESHERRALRELLEAIQVQASPGSTYNDGDTRHAVSLLNPYIASAMREAGAVLGKKVKR